MNYKNRLLEKKLTKLGQNFPVVVLTGARQVGKTTLLKHLLEQQGKYDMYTFDPVIDIGNARQDPELFLQQISFPVLLDEVQYAPEILAVIKRLVDINNSPGQYWLTGSQNFSMLRNVSETLAGRAAVLSLLPMSLGEAYDSPSKWITDFIFATKDFLSSTGARIFENKTVSLFSILWQGLYPGFLEKDPEVLHTGFDSYVRTYLERDVRLLNEIGALHEFFRFLQLTANLTAQEINYAQLGREIGVTPQTARRWLNILVASYQWVEIPAFSGNTIKRLSGKSKGYFMDTGMAAYLMHITSPFALSGHPRLGALFETFIVQEILKQISAMSVQPALYHWRSYGGAEVDLLLEIDDKYFPIEIKCKTRINKNDMRGINAFREAYPKLNIQPGIIIAPVDRIYALGSDCFVFPYDLKSLWEH